jgi:N-acetylglucosaminyldiphosphoundecaprenol N-acetyl-beta-D-mannosaminyltransferase
MHRHLRRSPSAGSARLPHRLDRRPEERFWALGGVMDLVKPTEVFHFVSRRIKARQKTVIANHNLHSLYLIQKNDEIRAFFNRADLVEIDSMPLIFWARLNGRPSRRFHRATYLDWRDEFWARVAAEGWRVFFLGGEPGVGEKARERILGQWPDIQLAIHHGYFDMAPGSSQNAEIIAQINAFAPDILLVGMGMPRQETWILRHENEVDARILFTVGGAFDYEAGVQKPAPRWLGQFGVEWLYRLILDPRRRFRRYCIEPFHLLGPAIRDLTGAPRERASDDARFTRDPQGLASAPAPDFAAEVLLARPDHFQH